MHIVAPIILACSLVFWPPAQAQAQKGLGKASPVTQAGGQQAGGQQQALSYDPSQNVLNLVEAAIKRLDDIAAIRAEHQKELRLADNALRALADRRIDDLIAAENRRVNEQATMRDVFYEKQRESEAQRVNAIRAVDVGAVGTANDRATQTANTLAAQVTQTAETARSLVASSATSIASAQAAFASQINERIANLEKLQNQNLGSNAPAQVQQLTAAIAALQKAQNESVGKGSGVDSTIGYIIAAVGLLLTLLGIAGFFLARREPPQQVFVDRPRPAPTPDRPVEQASA